MDITKREELWRWLDSQPREVAVIYAARAALRVAPVLATALKVRSGVVWVGKDLILPAFHAMAVSWTAGRYPARSADLRSAALFAADASASGGAGAVFPDGDAVDADALAAGFAALAAGDAAKASSAVHAAADAAVSALAAAGKAAYGGAHDALDAATAADAALIDQGLNSVGLAGRPLWPTEVPAWARAAWERLERALLAENEDWKVWTDWYLARLEGRPANEALEVARVTIAEEVWKEGPRAVNPEIQNLIDEPEIFADAFRGGDSNRSGSAPDFSKREDVTRWLAGKPREVMMIFAARAVLRPAPFLGNALETRGGEAPSIGNQIVLPAFRAMASSWVSGQYPSYGADFLSNVAAHRASSSLPDSTDAHSVLFAASTAVQTAVQAFGNSADSSAKRRPSRRASARSTADTASLAVEIAANVIPDTAAVEAAAADAALIDWGASPADLAGRPLWLTEMPVRVRNEWDRLARFLLNENLDWQVWTDWYQARLEGRPAIEALDVARVLIPDNLWEQGPRAVNAEIARLIAEHEEKHNGKISQPDSLAPPAVPKQEVAAIEPIWDERRLTISKHAAKTSLSRQKFAASLKALRQELREFADDLSGETNIDKRFVSFLKRLAERIPTSPPPQDELFQIAHMEEFFSSYATTVNAEWPAILASRYHALALHYERTMRQSPLWREFTRNAKDKKLSQTQRAATKPLAQETAKTLGQHEAADFVDAAIPASLERLAESMRQAEFADEIGSAPESIEAEPDLLAVDILESVNNILKRLAEAALRFSTTTGKGLAAGKKALAEAGGDYAKSFGKGFRKAAEKEGENDGEKAVKWLRRIVITGAVGGGLTGLLAKFPETFGWLEKVLHFIK